MRKVRVASTQFDIPRAIDTDVTTWGELQPILLDNGINTNNMTATLSPSNVVLQRNDAQLPVEDIIIFLNPAKVSAGNDEVEGNVNGTEIQVISVLSYNLLRSYASKVGIPLKGKLSKDDIANRILCFNLGLNNGVSEEEVKTITESEESKDLRNDAYHSLMDCVKEIKEIVEKATSLDLELTKEEMAANMTEEDAELMEQFRSFSNS